MAKYYAYAGAPAIDMPQLGESIGQGVNDSMGRILEDKRKSRDIELQLRMGGAIPEEEVAKSGLDITAPEVKPYIQTIRVFNKNWYLMPSAAEMIKAKYDAKKMADYESPAQEREAKYQDEVKLLSEKSKYEKPAIDIESQAYARERGKQKVDKTEELYKTAEENNYIRENLKNVEDALTRVDPSWMGTLKEKYLKTTDPNNELLADFQIIRTFATDETLLQSMKLKGAISDREINMLKAAAAGSATATAPQIKAIIEKAKRNITQSESSKIKSFKKTYGEDPMQWDDLKITPLMPDNVSNPEKQGGVLKEDKYGQKALVYPDGTYEEVQ